MKSPVAERFVVVAVFLVLAAGAVSGCGTAGNRVSVGGKVTVDGHPVESGTISFMPVTGTPGPSAGGPIRAGVYAISANAGPSPGKHRVEIKAMRKTGKSVTDDFGNTKDQIEQFVPARYNSQSELTVELKPGGNRDVNFDLRLGP